MTKSERFLLSSHRGGGGGSSGSGSRRCSSGWGGNPEQLLEPVVLLPSAARKDDRFRPTVPLLPAFFFRLPCDYFPNFANRCNFGKPAAMSRADVDVGFTLKVADKCKALGIACVCGKEEKMEKKKKREWGDLYSEYKKKKAPLNVHLDGTQSRLSKIASAVACKVAVRVQVDVGKRTVPSLFSFGQRQPPHVVKAAAALLLLLPLPPPPGAAAGRRVVDHTFPSATNTMVLPDTLGNL